MKQFENTIEEPKTEFVVEGEKIIAQDYEFEAE